MRLLIADDEELTRTGVIASIDWSSLGIDEIYQADDGIHGLEAAQKYQPEIILCDVRMPRMDGITMLSHIKHILPDSIVIFMSGYSDKEYLKAAIRLKAVSYIEKPLNPAEIREAITEAISLYHQNRHSQSGKSLHLQETASKLVLLLSSPYLSNAEKIEELCQELSISLQPDTCFTMFLIKMDDLTELSLIVRNELYRKLEDYLKTFGFHCLHGEKRSKYLLYVIYGSMMPRSTEIQKIGQFLVQNCEFLNKFMVVSGESMTGIQNAYQSYTSAVLALQSSFFFTRNTFLSCSSLNEHRKAEFSMESFPALLADTLKNREESTCTELLAQIYQTCFENSGLLQGQIQDFYYKLLFLVDDIRKQLLLPFSEESPMIADSIGSCFCYQELHHALQTKIQDFFSDATRVSSENRTITLIKEYISKNYKKDTLSVKDISSHVFLSTSYVCTFFKNETGKTLNQYLTEFRMEKAKALLGDPRYKIADISSKVGYSDGNYFGKSFKKYSGLSPSEYREKILS